MSPSCNKVVAFVSRIVGDSGGDAGFEGEGFTRLRTDLDSDLDFCLEGFVFAILKLWNFVGVFGGRGRYFAAEIFTLFGLRLR